MNIENEKLIQQFIKYLKKRDISQKTIDTYCYTYKEFFNKYDEITLKNLIKYKEWLINNKSAKTVSLRIIALNQFLKFHKIDLEIKNIKLPKFSYTNNIINTDEYLKILFYLKKNINNKTYYKYLIIIKILATTGIRISELFKLRLENFQNGYADIISKGNKARRIFIPKETCVLTLNWYEKNKYNLNENKLFNITSRGISEYLKSLSIKLNIDKNKLYPHSFRHFFAKSFLAKNKDISLLADILGHSNLSTTQIYMRKSVDEQRNEFLNCVTW